jgi:restriction system protein
MTADFDRLRRDLQWLRGEDGVVASEQAIEVLARVLAPLLAAEGLDLFAPESAGLGVDLVASVQEGDTRRASLAIEYKHHGRGQPLGVSAVRGLLEHLGTTPYERAMLIGRFGFTSDARRTARQREPASIELLDLDGIGAWIRRLEIGKPAHAAQIEILIRSISHEFAQIVARDARALDHLEWRDLERMVARVLEGLGFETTLTPPSKDGGKDVIVECKGASGLQSYIVELKHWRAGKRVGRGSVSHFMRVIVREERSGGLFLSTSGYAADAFEGLTEVTRSRLRLGGREKIVLLAKHYVRVCDGLWSPPTALPEVLFDSTH